MMDYADTPRQGDPDGRENLFQRALADFILWFLRVKCGHYRIGTPRGCCEAMRKHWLHAFGSKQGKEHYPPRLPPAEQPNLIVLPRMIGYRLDQWFLVTPH
jgi:hypothetical protein